MRVSWQRLVALVPVVLLVALATQFVVRNALRAYDCVMQGQAAPAVDAASATTRSVSVIADWASIFARMGR